MSEMDKKPLMQLPSEIKGLVSSGVYSLYKLGASKPADADYLLALSRSETYFLSYQGKILRPAGRLDQIEVSEVVRLDADHTSTIKLNIA